jgi:hypothetical protein
LSSSIDIEPAIAAVKEYSKIRSAASRPVAGLGSRLPRRKAVAEMPMAPQARARPASRKTTHARKSGARKYFSASVASGASDECGP